MSKLSLSNVPLDEVYAYFPDNPHELGDAWQQLEFAVLDVQRNRNDQWAVMVSYKDLKRKSHLKSLPLRKWNYRLYAQAFIGIDEEGENIYWDIYLT